MASLLEASAEHRHAPLTPPLSWVESEPTFLRPAVERALARVIRFAYCERAEEALADPALCEPFRRLIRRQLAGATQVPLRRRRPLRES